MITVAVIEDDGKIRKPLVELINSSCSCVCTHEFSNAEDALEILATAQVDVVLCDIQLPGMDGIECIAILKNVLPQLQIMMLTVFDDSERIYRALKNGASGYILKDTTPEKLIESIVDIYRGGSPMSSQIARKVVDAFSQNQARTTYIDLLSRRETEILELLAKGFRYKEIAGKLFISTETVRTHIRNIYDKLHVHSRIEALKKTGIL